MHCLSNISSPRQQTVKPMHCSCQKRGLQAETGSRLGTRRQEGQGQERTEVAPSWFQEVVQVDQVLQKTGTTTATNSTLFTTHENSIYSITEFTKKKDKEL